MGIFLFLDLAHASKCLHSRPFDVGCVSFILPTGLDRLNVLSRSYNSALATSSDGLDMVDSTAPLSSTWCHGPESTAKMGMIWLKLAEKFTILLCTLVLALGWV